MDRGSVQDTGGFDAQIQSTGAAVVVRAQGEVDLATAARFAAALDRARGIGADLLVVDLARVSFLDSTGLKVLLDMAAAAERSGSRLVVAGSRPTVHRVLTITGMAGRLDARPLGEPWPWPEVAAGATG